MSGRLDAYLDEAVQRGSLWLACSYPERPTDPYVIWHKKDCGACLIKAKAVQMQHPDNEHLASLIATMEANAAAAGEPGEPT